MELKSEKCGNFLTWETKSYLMVGVEDVLANAKVGSICTLPFDILLACLTRLDDSKGANGMKRRAMCEKQLFE